MSGGDLATNRKARRDYEILERHEAGIELKGTEVKSIREGKVNIADAFARIEKGQIFLYGCHIQPWETAGQWYQHETTRKRRLLLHKREILKLEQDTTQRGLALPCLRMYWKGSRVKVEIGVGRGRKHADLRQELKKRTEMREAQREVSRFHRR